MKNCNSKLGASGWQNWDKMQSCKKFNIDASYVIINFSYYNVFKNSRVDNAYEHFLCIHWELSKNSKHTFIVKLRLMCSAYLSSVFKNSLLTVDYSDYTYGSSTRV